MKVGIVGAGLIGKKRALALSSKDTLIAVADTQLSRATDLAQTHQAKVLDRWETLVADPGIDAVIVATTNNAIPPIAQAALEGGKHVLIEKPGGRFPKEIEALENSSKRSKGILRVGFNHRFHPALKKAHAVLKQPEVGPLMYIRARYGHGGRIGYDKEWRADPKIAGGGELLDQGVHLIDLTRWLGGEFEFESGLVHTFFWNMPVEDNGFLCLRSPDKKRAAWLHASCTEWKNLFDFEIFCKFAKIEISGLGRSYGTEELRVFQMKPEMGPPDLTTETFVGEDLSWNNEWEAFTQETEGIDTPIAKIQDARRAVEIVHQAYDSNRT